MRITDFNFLGEYKKINPNGSPVTYNRGDVVYLNNESFIASKTITGINPHSRNSGWLSLAKVQVFYESPSAPVFAKNGDEWYDSDSGILYKRLKDNNGEHWVEF
jgi:hypothetical protein|tara:strand:+ start:984 stop:1295 length:312 start_codon:yes stop_codon:yes gene_type:complete